MKFEVLNINKSFGDHHVLKDVSFSVESASAFAFLGRNGAGKTTTLRIIMDVYQQDSGEILIDDKPYRRKDVTIGYLPEERGLYAKEKVYNQLIYFARLKGASRKFAKENVNYWISRFGLEGVKDSKLETLSKGNQQKVQIIEALLNDPEVIILDEPFSGLDPINAQELRKVIREFIQSEKIVIFSSHQMGFVEEFCDKVGIIDDGVMIVNGDINQLKEELADGKIVVKASNVTALELREIIAESVIITEAIVDNDKVIVKLGEGITKKQFLGTLINRDVAIESFYPYDPGLQEIFISKVGDR